MTVMNFYSGFVLMIALPICNYCKLPSKIKYLYY